MQNVVFRVDSSYQIGSGHVMRCLTLAEELIEKGYYVSFITRDHKGNMADFISNKGYKVFRLKKPPSSITFSSDLKHGSWLGASQEEDAEETLKAIQSLTIELLVVDHYGIDYRWEKKFQGIAKKILVIDDLADRKHDCEFLLDQNYRNSMQNRYKNLVKENCRLFLGPSHLLLRKEFKTAKIKSSVRSGEINRILIFFGGSDPTSETLKTLEALRMLNLKNTITDVIVGDSNVDKQRIKEICKISSYFNYYCQISNMAELIARADLAIGAGGSTTWERCYLGLPSLTITVAENQKEILHTLDKAKIIINLGESQVVTANDIANKVKYLIQNPILVKNLSKASLDFCNMTSNIKLIDFV